MLFSFCFEEKIEIKKIRKVKGEKRKAKVENKSGKQKRRGELEVKMYKPRKTESKLLIYQKYVDLIEYSYNLLVKYPKYEKYALVSEIRRTMYNSLRYILYANKISDKYSRISILGKLDAEISMMGFFVRFSYKNKYINTNNYYTWSKKIEEIGKILGGVDKVVPKRVNNIFKKNVTFSKLLEAHNKCKKIKDIKNK